MALVRELAPVMSGFAVIALAGSAYASEICTMRTNSQLDALRMLRVDPVRYLMAPRLIAATVAVPLITVITAVSGILGGMWVSHYSAGIATGNYLESAWIFLGLKDVFGALLKAAVFGFLIATLSCTIGFATGAGAKNVGLATTRAVVWSFVGMAVADYALTFLLYGTRGF